MKAILQHREIIILSGLSGSGKSSALRTLEDAGYFSIDNLPGALFSHLLALIARPSRSSHLEHVALVMDAREKEFTAHFKDYLKSLKARRIRSRLFFFDARDEVLIRRFSETRRRHPLAPLDRVSVGIHKERQLLHPLREIATRVIDTSDLNVHELRQRVLSFLTKDASRHRLSVTLVSFGYRYGIPLESDLVLDLRFLPNPHFVKNLRPLTGQNPKVARFVLKQRISGRFMKVLKSFLGLLLKQYVHEGKAYLTIGFGCTGGRHRSVAISEEVAKGLKRSGYPVKIQHRDLKRAE